MKVASQNKNGRAFTLVELLVVLAIGSAIWGAVRPQISAQIHDYQLLGDISAYYASVEVLGRLYDRFLDLMMGTAASLPQAPVHRGNLRTFLSHRMMELKADADRILNQLDAKDAALFKSLG